MGKQFKFFPPSHQSPPCRFSSRTWANSSSFFRRPIKVRHVDSLQEHGQTVQGFSAVPSKSAMSILFKNIAKKANDLLSDKNTSKKFSVATEAANGTKYNAEASISGASVSGKVGASLKHDSGFNVDKVEFDNKGTLTTNITLDKAVDN